MTFFYPLAANPQFLQSKTLIVPVVSVANVSQLAADLLIATLDLQQIGVFDARDLIPVVGARENGENGITTPLELYGKEHLDFVVIQQRSPALKARKESFITSIMEFAKEFKFGAVLLVSGVDLSNRTDAQMHTPTYAIIPHGSPSLDSTALSGIKDLPIYTSPTTQASQALPTPSTDVPFIPGGGLSRRFLSSLPTQWSIPSACILQFVMEGDNRADAALLADAISRTLKINEKVAEWRQPKSWREGLFGTPHDQTLFG
ncbi:hypothetical protein BD410DRAFT_784296 [Rickenella mellea]|uniref:Proteasome assembly chaperone 2 n=1 Tax=Rickenella mellea TaxID=50990 RepID=A0A4Y7QGA3_9AGAM|nr:hypothetical protein BD410DRAFT_784296 [Rickenella mellea]